MTNAAFYEDASGSLERRFRRSRHVQQANQAGTITLFDGTNYYTLPNEATNELWALLAEPRSAEELVARLYDTYEAPREVIALDVEAHLAVLRRKGLAVEVGHDGEPIHARHRWWWFSWWRFSGKVW